jgi:hypothetical protein
MFSFDGRSRIYETLTSLFAAGILLAQAGVVIGAVVGDAGISGKKFWPIVSYHMYSESRFEGETIEVHDLLNVVRADGTLVPVTKEELKLNLWDYRHLSKGLKRGDEIAVRIFQQRYPVWSDFEEIRVLSYPLMITRDGPAKKPSEVLASVPLKPLTSAAKSE